MKNKNIKKIVYNYSFYRESDFKKWFAGIGFNLRHPIVGITLGFTFHKTK